MIIAGLIRKMTEFCNGNQQDITHFLRVWAYAKTLGELEGLDQSTQLTLEAAAVVHDIACPFLREQTGKAEYSRQEELGAPMAWEFLQGTGLTRMQIARAAFMAGHHHTWEADPGKDFSILLEADYLVNAADHGLDKDAIGSFASVHFRSAAGRQMLEKVFSVALDEFAVREKRPTAALNIETMESAETGNVR